MLSFLLAIGARLGALGGAGEDEAALLARIAGGERAALRSLYDRLSGVTFAVALRILTSRPEAEEVVQDCFLDVWTRARLYDPARGSARTWVVSIARNRAIDRLRSRGGAAKATDAARAEAALAVEGTTPLETAERRQARERIQAALAELPAEQRQVLELGYFEGLTQSEIAERVGEPLGTIKSRVRAALEKLARTLADGAGQ
jgi:RNA polymerase sigma-70 factor (ECF subfamily)